MLRSIVAGCAAAVAIGLVSVAGADDNPDTKPIIDKAIKALGGEEALGKVKSASWKGTTKTTFQGNEAEGASQVTVQDLDHFRQEITGNFGGNPFKAVIVLDGDKGARKFGDMRTDFDKAGVIDQKRVVYLTLIPVTLLPLKSKDFKTEMIAEEKIDDKPAVGLKVTGPEGKDFKIYFDKESGLPVRIVAKVPGFQNNTVLQENTFSDYKDMAGIKKATKVVVKRDGAKFQEMQVTEFKTLDKVDPKTFSEVD